MRKEAKRFVAFVQQCAQRSVRGTDSDANKAEKSLEKYGAWNAKHRLNDDNTTQIRDNML
ncbi:hypothetical protein D3C71_2011970 [compost metagenome]